MAPTSPATACSEIATAAGTTIAGSGADSCSLTAMMTMATTTAAATGPAGNLMALAIAVRTQRTIAIEQALLSGKGCFGSPFYFA